MTRVQRDVDVGVQLLQLLDAHLTTAAGKRAMRISKAKQPSKKNEPRLADVRRGQVEVGVQVLPTTCSEAESVKRSEREQRTSHATPRHQTAIPTKVQSAETDASKAHRNGSVLIVVHSDAVRAGENEVLGRLDAQAAQTRNEDIHLLQLAYVQNRCAHARTRGERRAEAASIAYRSSHGLRQHNSQHGVRPAKSQMLTVRAFHARQVFLQRRLGVLSVRHRYHWKRATVEFERCSTAPGSKQIFQPTKNRPSQAISNHSATSATNSDSCAK